MPKSPPDTVRLVLDVPTELMARVRAQRGRSSDTVAALRLIEKGLAAAEEHDAVLRLRQESEQTLDILRAAAEAMRASSVDLRDGVLTLLERSVPRQR